MFDLQPYLDNFVNLPWLGNNILHLVVSGSQAYGTALPTSDLDVKGIAVPPRGYLYGFLHQFEQAQTNNPSDFTVFDIRKFFNLASSANPNILELVFTKEEDWLWTTDVYRTLIYPNRYLFLSKKCKYSYSGYSISQLNKAKSHRRWLLTPPQKPPSRQEFGLPDHTVIPRDQLQAAESQVRKKVDSWSIDYGSMPEADKINLINRIAEVFGELSSADVQWSLAAKTLGVSTNFLEIIDSEKRFNTKQREWEQYQEWKKNRNPVRAALEDKMGYDGKNVAHLYRLMRTCREILETGDLLVRRPDAEELLAIRNGSLSYEAIVEWAQNEDKALEEVMNKSKLPNSPDREKLDTLCVQIMETFYDTKR